MIIGKKPHFVHGDDVTERKDVSSGGSMRDTIEEQEKTIKKLRKEISTMRLMLEQANRDSMTELSSRNTFTTEFPKILSLAVRAESDIALIMLDLDDLKKTNDSKGHIAGDNLIKNAASVIKNTIRGEDFGYRYGGDEFVVIGLAKSEERGSHLLSRLKKNMSAAGINCSMGLSMLRENSDIKPKEPISAGMAAKIMEELLATADRNMYAEKRSKTQG